MAEKEPYDAADPEAEKRVRAQSELRDANRKKVVIAVMAMAEGREWMWQVLKDCHTFEERVTITGGQYEQGVFNGARNVGLDLMRYLAKADPQAFAVMLKEHDG